jgi:CIC family chloride channel protein
MSEARLRIIVACGAAGGIAATFNAPITGLFFGFEIVLREFSFDALFATILGAVTGDVISRAFFGSAPFFAGIPHGLALSSDAGYLLIIVLGVASGLVGLGFKTVLYKLEDVVDDLWGERPEWLRPAVGGIALGVLLLALPELYGVGYPVMDKAFAGQLVVGLIVLLVAGKILATSLTLAIGGSGGVFAPSLFMGAMTGMAFGIGAHDLFGPAVGRPAIYAVVAMGALFGGAAQAPLTAMASVIEMTGNFTLTVPVMLATGIAAAVCKQLSYGGIYTTKLLRRGVDIERPRAEHLLESLTVGELMHPIRDGGAQMLGEAVGVEAAELAELIGPVADVRSPQALFAEETLAQALRQLVLYGRSGLPVLSRSGDRVLGWLDDEDVLAAITAQVGVSEQAIEHGAVVADSGSEDPRRRVHVPTTPVEGHALVEAVVGLRSQARGRRVDEVRWPPGSLVVALRKGHEVCAPRPDTRLEPGTRVVLLVPAPAADEAEEAEVPARAQSPA